jgi:hypothetical protein
MLNAFERPASFKPGEHSLEDRLLDGYKAAIALVGTNHDGIISAAESDIDTPNPHCPQGDNSGHLPAPAELRPLRRDTRDQRPPARAPLRAQHAGTDVQVHFGDPQSPC